MLIFGNAELCSQFLRNYIDIPLLKNVKAEDIEDVTERYVPMFTEERNSDTVKRIKLAGNNTLFFVSLIEHKTKVDYNVCMQLLRYMVYIWEDYEKEMERHKKGISKSKGFKYPPILPIVYYEGTGKWTAVRNRQELNLPDDYLKNLSEHSTEEILSIVARVTAAMLRQLNLPEDEVEGFTEQVKERKMAVLFEHFKSVDIPAERKKAREEGWAEGHAEGEARFARLTQALLQSARMDDLSKAAVDIVYREELYGQLHL